MYRTALAMLAIGSLAVLGCDSKTPPGGPGASQVNTNKPHITTPDNTFQVSVPGSETVKQGESKTVTVGIKRGTNFDQDVKLDAENVPQGVTIKFDGATLPASEKETHMTITAAADAALGDHTVSIVATPAREGAKTTTEFKLTVKKP